MAEKGWIDAPAGETAVAFSGPAVLANRTYVSLVAAGVRLSFTEQDQPNSPVHFRTAVVLSAADAIAFKNVLAVVVADIEKQLQEHVKKEQENG